MILKQIASKNRSFKNIVNYFFNGLDQSPESGWVLYDNLLSTDKIQIIQEFQENAQLIPKDPNRKRIIYFHTILSFHPDSTPHLTPDMMKDFAENFIKERNDKTMTLAVPHYDKHWHIHILQAMNEPYSTKADLHISTPDFRNLRESLERYQLNKYGDKLIDSVVYLKEKEQIKILGKSAIKPKLSNQEDHYKRRTGKDSNKERISKELQRYFDSSRSLEAFIKKIESTGKYQVYNYRNKPTGILVLETNKKMRFRTLGILPDQHLKLLERLGTLERVSNKDKGNEMGLER